MVQDKGKPEEAIFKAAIQCQDRHQRQAYVWNACSGNPRLLAEVEVLLQYHDTNSFLDALALDPDVRLDEPVLTEGPGTVIGRYKLLEKIGEGGMAVVYMAEQEHPIRRKVALKIIKLGMDTRQVIARFEAERQALALMDHPSIAKVFDAGSTETGRPYFVMELVQGVSITEYCDKNNLCTKDRLHLFLQVCQAVQHAHTKGIIHRDIKPSNVMVTSHDGEALPKVIDFGIAKATNQKLTEKTLFTRYAHLIGTPAYMSPEQAQLSDLDIDTRSDIYSLGVLLYELLSGTTPFSEEELRKAGYLEMQRVIREQEPVKPSTRIRTALRGASVPARRGEGILPLRVAGILPALRRRPRTGEPLRVRLDTEETKAKMASGRKGGTPSPQLPYRRPAYEQVRGDLDWIVMKSLEKDRTRRYETASGLAEDIRRHLEHEPVLARGPSAVYRVGRFLRRHRSGVVGVAAFVVLLAGVALLLSIWKQDRLQWQQDRLQLAAADELRHQALLSQAQGQYAGGERDAALETIQPILDSPHVGGKAQLLRAGILVDNRRSEDAVAVLGDLLDEKPEIAGAAHSLLARILWESESPNTERLQEIEERRKKAEALLPETAEAHFLRAMTAITVKEQLAALDRALQLDPSHFESRRLRAFTFYASRKYDRLKDDALVMTVVRPRDALGYALRAVAGRELGRYREAMADYDLAIALTPSADPQHADLSIQRRETLLRMEDFERVIAETPPASQDLASPVLRYHTFGALTALGEYDTATILFREIIAPGREARQKFNNWCAKYVFDTLTAGRSWYLTDQGPTGAAFLPMIEAEETYRSLAGKGGRRLTVDGFSADWSPDAKKLAFSLGVHGHSGVAIFDPATKETDLLIVPGKDPRWSPDGKYIAFVRDRQFLRLSEFIAAVRRDQRRVLTDEEVWLMRADGTEPRRLTRGGWPSWNRDSTTVYYASRADYSLCSISVERENAEPNRIMACTWYYPSVSPDSRRVAYLEGGYLKVRDLASQSIVAQQPAPFKTSGGPTWSPTGGELSLGGPNHSEELTGLWVYDLGKSQPIGVLNGQVTAGSWAPDGTQFIFCLGPPYYEIWSADLDPQREKTSEAFTPTQTLDEHFRRMVGVYTNRVESDPTDANNYLQRAQQYQYLGEEAEVRANMRQYTALLGAGGSPRVLVSPSSNSTRTIGLPFDCELVFSAERPVNTIPKMSVAFGQKGRCEMKLCQVPMFIASLFGVLAGLDAPQAHGNFLFSEPVNLGLSINSPNGDAAPHFSADGLSLFFDSDRSGQWEIWRTTRKTKDDPWGPSVSLDLGEGGGPCVSADGLTLYFHSSRAGGYGRTDLWVTTRGSIGDPWGPPKNLGPVVNSGSYDYHPDVSADGLTLYFQSNRAGGLGDADIWMTTRATKEDVWGTPVNLGPAINSPDWQGGPAVSADGRVLFFASGDDIAMATRPAPNDDWGPAAKLNLARPSSAWDALPCISPDGSILAFCAERPNGVGGIDLWQSQVIPLVDFNGDGSVDGKDLLVLLMRLGGRDSLCDIGPYAWGDGKVDVEDLKVLAEYIGQGFQDPTLVAHWAFDETEGDIAADSAGDSKGKNNATVIRGSLWRPEGGRIGGTLEFTGMANFATANSPLSPADNCFSILAWVRGGAPGQVVISQINDSDWLMADPIRGTLSAHIPGAPVISSDVVITDGDWHRLGFVSDGFHRVLYADGKEVARDSRPGLAGSSARVLMGAGKNLAPGTFWKGLIDEVRVYNRVVRP